MSIVIAVKAYAADGTTLILNMGSSSSYEYESLTLADRTYRRATAVSPDIEGNVELQSVLDAGVYELSLRVIGSSTADVNSKRATLLAAVETRSWVLSVGIDGSITKWKANRADSVTSQERMYLHNFIRPMVIRVPVQPTPVP
jgi:hypothetical protein